MRGSPISVIIPTFNRARYVRQAVDSVLAQGDSVLEVIVVDDGSTDETPILLQSYSPRLRYVRQPNRGVSAARNKGVSESRGDYLAFLDSDDLWANDRVPLQIDSVSRGVMCFGGVEWFLDDQVDCSVPADQLGVRWPRIASDGKVVDPVLDVADGRYLHLGTLLCARADFESVGRFNEALTMGEDEDWFSRASLKFQFQYTSQTLLRRRLHSDQIAQDSEPSIRSLIKVLTMIADRTEAEHGQAHSRAKRRLAAKWSHLANYLRADDRPFDAREAARVAFGLNPMRLDRWLRTTPLADWIAR